LFGWLTISLTRRVIGLFPSLKEKGQSWRLLSFTCGVPSRSSFLAFPPSRQVAAEEAGGKEHDKEKEYDRKEKLFLKFANIATCLSFPIILAWITSEIAFLIYKNH